MVVQWLVPPGLAAVDGLQGGRSGTELFDGERQQWGALLVVVVVVAAATG
jgi:hypothetical protein